MASITLDLSGDKALISKIESLDSRITIIAGRVLKKAVQPILAKTEALAPVGKRKRAGVRTKDALLMRKATTRKGRVRVIVQETADKGMPFYVPFAMLGHKTRSGSQVKGNEFMQRAFNAEAQGAKSSIEQGLRDEIEKAAKTA